MKKLVLLLFCLVHLSLLAPNIPTAAYDAYFDKVDTIALHDFLFWERDRLIKDLEFTPELLMEYLVRLRVESPKIVFKQAVLETGWFRSINFRSNNNLFGMNFPYVRPTLAKFRTPRGFAYYSDWRDSVKDYLLWQKYKSQWHDQENYYVFLKNVGYAEDPYYNQKLQSLNIQNYTKMAEKILSSIDFHQEHQFAQKVQIPIAYPELNTNDILKCEMYVNDLNLLHEVKLIIDLPKRKALIIKDGVVGFIQKRNDQLFAHFKDGLMENISQRVQLQKLFDHYKVFRITEDNTEFNFNGIVNIVQNG